MRSADCPAPRPTTWPTASPPARPIARATAAALAGLLLAGASLPATGAVPLDAALAQRLRGGEPVTVLVEIDAAQIAAAAAGRRARLPSRADDAALLARLAADYGARKEQLLGRFRHTEVDAQRDYSHLPMRALRLRGEAGYRALAALPGVRALHVDRRHELLLAQSLPLVQQPAAAAAGLQGNGSTVAVIDSGVDLAQPAFGGCTAPGVPAACRIAADLSFVNGGAPTTDHAHGTNVAAIVLGVAPAARVASLNVFSAGGGALSSDIVAAINWAIANRALYNIVALNLSLGDTSRNATPCGNGATNPFLTAVGNARAAGISVVAAAGNAGYNNGTFIAGLSGPACTPGVVSVGAVYDAVSGGLTWAAGTAAQCTDAAPVADRVTCFSNSASYLSLMAPGALITAGGQTKGGTSQATPHVAGALALLRAAHPGETLAAIEARLRAPGATVLDARTGWTHPRLALASAARPPNDDWAAATAVLGTDGSAAGTNRLATQQVGEPSPPGAAGSVWWRWTAPASGQVRLETVGSSFDTHLAVYTGGAVNALAEVAANDNAAVGWTASGLWFQAQAGTAYHWAVRGMTGQAGAVALGWALDTTASANLALAIAGPAPVLPGASANYTFTVSNAGPQAATGVLMRATLPTGVVAVGLPAGCVSTSVSAVRCAAPSLAAGQVLAFVLGLRIDNLGAGAALQGSVSSEVPDAAAPDNVASLRLDGAGVGSEGDVPTLPQWGLLALAGGLLWPLLRLRRGGGAGA